MRKCKFQVSFVRVCLSCLSFMDVSFKNSNNLSIFFLFTNKRPAASGEFETSKRIQRTKIGPDRFVPSMKPTHTKAARVCTDIDPLSSLLTSSKPNDECDATDSILVVLEQLSKTSPEFGFFRTLHKKILELQSTVLDQQKLIEEQQKLIKELENFKEKK